MKKLNRILIGATVAGMSTAALAQSGEITEVQVNVRRPMAESMAAALQAQRNSTSLVSVLSADAIGNLPDQNIAFAVGRLPGVGIERDQGQARYVNLRGAPNYWTTLSYDGLSIVSPEGRASRFDNIPSAIAKQVVVQKAIVPSMAGNTVAGNVDIITRSGFDNPGQVMTGKVGLGRVKLGEGDEIDSAFTYSNVLLDGSLGVVAQGSYYKREMATDNWETDPYLGNTVNPAKRFAREHENKHYRLVRENYSATLRLDYQLDENNTLYVSTINTMFADDELRDNFIVRLDQGTDATGAGYTSSAFINGNDPVSGTVYGARINSRIDYRDIQEYALTHTLGGEHDLSDWNVSWRVNRTMTDDGRNTPVSAAFQSPSSFALRPTVEYDFRDGDANTMRFFSTGGATAARTKGPQVTNIEDFQFPMQSMTSIEGSDRTVADTFKLDLDRDIQLFGLETTLEFGGLYTDRTKTSAEASMQASFSGTTAPTWATFATDMDYLGSAALGYNFRYTDSPVANNFMESLVRTGAATAQDTRGNYWQVTEEITALYAMATSQFNWGSLVYGARVEEIENTGQAWVSFPAAGLQLVDVSSSDTMVYPSVHLNWDATEDVKVRFGLTTSASRPDFDDLRPNFTINDAAQSISGGNPDAQPERQTGLDAYLEWYLPSGDFFSAGVFYKDLRDVLVNQSNVFGSDTLDVAGIDRSGYIQSAIGNAGDGNLGGIEFAYIVSAERLAQAWNLPEWTGGFGVNFSATFTDSEVTLPSLNGVPSRTIKVLGTSDEVYNIQATYEKYGLTARLAYQYRTPWGQGIGDYRVVNGVTYPSANGDIFWDTDDELDLSLRYQLNDSTELFMDAMNLTNMAARRYGHDSMNPIEVETFGRRYMAGVRFNF
jgi:TonB-dependent receptor